MGLHHSPRIVTDGLVLCLDAADKNSYPGSGNTWTDLSGQGNNGTLVNDITFSNTNIGSFSFDGVDESVDINGYNFGSGEITIFSWIFKSSNAQATAEGIISKSDIGKREFHLRIEDSPLNGILFWKSDTGSGAGNVFDTGESITLNKWQNIAVSMDSSNVNFFLNGNNIKSYTGSYTLFNGDAKIRVGGWSEGGGYFFNGDIPVISVYNRALTATEIQQNYNATKTRFGL